MPCYESRGAMAGVSPPSTQHVSTGGGRIQDLDNLYFNIVPSILLEADDSLQPYEHFRYLSSILHLNDHNHHPPLQCIVVPASSSHNQPTNVALSTGVVLAATGVMVTWDIVVSTST